MNFPPFLPPALHLSLTTAAICPLQASLQLMPEDECQLWWASKELQRGKKLQDYVGKNEKTKLVVKMQKVRYFVHSIMFYCLFYFSFSVFLDHFICILYPTFTKLPHLIDRTAGSLFLFKYKAFFTLQYYFWGK